MVTNPRVLGISGSLRAASRNTALLKAAAEALEPGARLELWTGLAAVAPFSEDDEAVPPAPVRRMREAIAGADALLIATPEYNGSIPGQLKNALDWASRPYGDSALTGKPVMVLGASPSDFGAEWARDALRKSLELAGARVLSGGLALPKADVAFDDDGRLREPHLRVELAEALRELIGEGTSNAN